MAARPALLVIGPSRSGSSALTAVLSMRGATLPAHLMPGGKGNERGHFEPERLERLNTAILAALGGGYWDPIAIPQAWFASAEASAFTVTIAETIAAEYGDGPLPIIKDPRLCRLAPLYLAACAQLGLKPYAIIPLRHPGAAARSLSARDKTPPETAELLQVIELLNAERHTRDIPRAWSRYADLLADWRSATDAIAAQLGLVWPACDAEAIEAFLTSDLRHQSVEEAGPLATHLYETALSGDEAAIRGEFGRIRAISDEHDRLIGPWQSAWRGRLAGLEGITKQQATQIKQLEEEAAAATRRRTETEAHWTWRLTAPFRRR